MALSSVHASLSCDDILCEILLRVPPETIFRLIIVSKRWLHFICFSSIFRHSYLKIWKTRFHLLGFFVCNNLYLGRPRNGPRRPPKEPALPFLSTSTEGDDIQYSGILEQLGYLIDSSNGLLLCGRHPKTYYVWNPISKQRYQLPHPRVHFEELCMAFLVESTPHDDLHFRVIRAKCETSHDEVDTVPIETFHSKTRTWNYSTLTCSEALSLSAWTAATVIKGVVHWYAGQGKIAIYDPKHGRKHLDLIELPGSYDFDERVLGESADGLLHYGWSNQSGMEIWVLEKGQGCPASSFSISKNASNVWNLRYKLNFKTMWKGNPMVMTKFWARSKETQLSSFLPQNSESVFIKSGSDIFLYHLESGMLEVVLYHGRSSYIIWDFCKVVPYFRPSWPTSSRCPADNVAA